MSHSPWYPPNRCLYHTLLGFVCLNPVGAIRTVPFSLLLVLHDKMKERVEKSEEEEEDGGRGNLVNYRGQGCAEYGFLLSEQF